MPISISPANGTKYAGPLNKWRIKSLRAIEWRGAEVIIPIRHLHGDTY